MKNYEAPTITQLGSISDLTQGTGTERGYDNAYGQIHPLLGYIGYFNNTGGSPSGSAG
jgi:hypothetical protein